jgi:hypothetical protein
MNGRIVAFHGHNIFVPNSVSDEDLERFFNEQVLAGRDGKEGKPGLPGRNGADGRDGQAGKNGLSGANGLDGKDGQDGKDGMPGRHGLDGRDGKDGVGIRTVTQPDDETIVFELTDGSKHPVKLPRGADGQDGKDGQPGVKTVVVNRLIESGAAQGPSSEGASSVPNWLDASKVYLIAAHSQVLIAEEIDMEEGAEIEFEEGAVLTEVN